MFQIVLLFSLCANFVQDWDRLKQAQPEGYVCSRADHIVIDGRLDEPAWAKVPWTHDFQDIEGAVKSKPRFRTRAKMLWDDQYFYVAAELEEPHVWGTITNHDAVIFRDPDFEVFIDPDGDRHNYIEFEMNALNTGWDLLLKKPYIDGGPALNEYEIAGLKTAVHVNGTLNDSHDKDQSWTVEIAFPWESLRPRAGRSSPPTEGDVWRVDFSRVEWQIQIVGGKYVKVADTKEDNWVWSSTGMIDMHRPENWGQVLFTKKSEAPAFHAQRDPDADLLLSIYYAQKDFYAQNKRWAKSSAELPGVRLAAPMSFPAREGGYSASIRKLTITQDGQLRSTSITNR